MTTPIREAKSFILNAALVPSGAISQAAEESPDTPFEAGRAQASVVNSNVVAFPGDAPVDVRQAVTDSMLFAQLHADHEVPDRNDVKAWMDTYFGALPKLGWALAGDSGNETEESALGSELHQKILEFLAVALGPATTALALVASALTSLQGMQKDSPWITLFNRRAKGAKAAGVEMTHADVNKDGNVTLKGTSVRLDANQQITQVLFFKFTSNSAKLYRRAVSMTIAGVTLAELAPDIHGRVLAYEKASILNMAIG